MAALSLFTGVAHRGPNASGNLPGWLHNKEKSPRANTTPMAQWQSAKLPAEAAGDTEHTLSTRSSGNLPRSQTVTPYLHAEGVAATMARSTKLGIRRAWGLVRKRSRSPKAVTALTSSSTHLGFEPISDLEPVLLFFLLGARVAVFDG